MPSPFGSRPGDDVIRFGPAGSEGQLRSAFELDPGRLELRRHGCPVEMRPQATRVLCALLRHEGRLVPVDELRHELWGSRHIEWRNGLHQVVRELRRALGDDARRPRFVETVARLGYRFVGERLAPEGPARVDAVPPRSRLLREALRRRSVAFAAGFAAAVLLPAALFAACVLFGG